MIIAITAHTRYATTELVRHALRDRLASHQGADQIFADVVLEHGGTIEVAVPSQDYFLHPRRQHARRSNAPSTSAPRAQCTQRANRERTTSGHRRQVSRVDHK
ncbi:hypothetical protein [Promicromonospora soli]